MYKVIPVVAGIITLNGFVLLTKKHSEHPDTDGRWEFPGGKVEQGESLADALKRELYEELNKLEVVVGKLVYAQMNYYSFAGALVTYFQCSPVPMSYVNSVDMLSMHLNDIEHTLILPSGVSSLKVLPGTKEALSYGLQLC